VKVVWLSAPALSVYLPAHARPQHAAQVLAVELPAPIVGAPIHVSKFLTDPSLLRGRCLVAAVGLAPQSLPWGETYAEPDSFSVEPRWPGAHRRHGCARRDR
jgi:hypothetical protein